jgi:hypothetical protein
MLLIVHILFLYKAPINLEEINGSYTHEKKCGSNMFPRPERKSVCSALSNRLFYVISSPWLYSTYNKKTEYSNDSF